MKTQAEIIKLVKKDFPGENIVVGFEKKERISPLNVITPLKVVTIKRDGKGYNLIRYTGRYYSHGDKISLSSGWSAFHIKKYSDAIPLAKKAVSMEWY